MLLGGDEDWRTVLTLPNIFREFNPRVIGTSGGELLQKNFQRQKSGLILNFQQKSGTILNFSAKIRHNFEFFNKNTA